MKFRLYTQYGALNSKPVFDALSHGLRNYGHEIVDTDEDVAVIWSVLWNGRMIRNKEVYELCQQKNIPIMIIEVGNLSRGNTWRLSIGNINRLGIFGNDVDLDHTRPSRLSVKLMPVKTDRRPEILIATQHQNSLQWKELPPVKQWVTELVSKIKKVSDRTIIVRPHPRSMIDISLPGVTVQRPIKVPGTYDNFDIDYNYHCVINFNSGPAVQAAINGTPVICDSSSLAYPISDQLENIENINLPNRDEWFLKLCHTEWTTDELEQGFPQERLIKRLTKS